MKMLFKGDVEGYSVDKLIDWVSQEFQVEKGNLSTLDFVVAIVNEYGYDGESYFLVSNRETGEFFEVDVCHCSCYGYEGMWEPKLAPSVYLLSDFYKRGDEEVRNFVRSLFN
jgi:hypothetical protein